VRRRAATKTEGRSRCYRDRPISLIRFPPLLLAQSLPRKRFFCPALLAGFHVETVLLDFLDDVLLLHLALETPQGIFQGFTLLDDDFSHFIKFTPNPVRIGILRRLLPAKMTGYALLRAPPLLLIIACLVRFVRTLIGRWLLLINSAHISQGIFAFLAGVRVLSLPHNHPGTLLTQI